MTKVFDYDAFRGETEQEPVFFKIDGKEYPMSPTIPASMVLKIVRMKHDLGTDAAVTIEVFDALGRSVFGTDVWDTLLIDHKVGFEEMPKLMEAVIRSYVPKEMTSPDPTSEKSPSSSESSSPGPGSKPTSSESTEST